MATSPLHSTWPARALAAAALALALLLGAAAFSSHRSGRAAAAARHELEQRLPHLQREDDYVSSHACLSCHPGEHASWHASFHRTMTQVAAPDTVAGAFDGSVVTSGGLDYRVYRKGAEFWAEMPDPEEMMYVVQGGKPTPLEQIPRVHRRVVLCTGSHHYQTYWVTGDPRYGRLLQTLPLVYLISEQRWIPREDAFMRAPGDSARLITQWNTHCINCHSTGGNPALITDTAEGRFDTRVAEMGIACEACHGPGRQHIEANRSALRRYALHLHDEGDPTIVNPARLDHRRSSQVCGQCHGVFIRDDTEGMRYAESGVEYQPGDDLHARRYYISYPDEDAPPERREELQRNPSFFRERWWDDGSILAGGREYTALAASACFTKGALSCLQCHSMHDSDPVDQLKAGTEGSTSCVSCHRQPHYTTEVARHTFHDPQSSGSNCLNCHMPHTTYALFSAIRSHQIDSPSVSRSVRHGVPNACNLCHLDRTLAWTQEHLASRYGHAPEPLSREQTEVAASLLWLLQGHAAQRVIASWHLGWEPARAVSGQDWLAPFQARLLEDPYGVVRYVAQANLRKLPGFTAFPYDFLAPSPERHSKVQEALRRWEAVRPPGPPRDPAALLLDSAGAVREDAVQDLLHRRDNRPVDIKE